MCLTNCLVRVSSVAVALLLCDVASSAVPVAALDADCEPQPASQVAEFSLVVAGKGRAARRQKLPGGSALLIVAGERGIDVRLEIAGDGGTSKLLSDSPMRRWGPQRMLLGRGPDRTVEIAAIGKERAHGSVQVQVFRVRESESTKGCIEAQRLAAAADAFYARAQQITQGEVVAAAGVADRDYQSAISSYEASARQLGTRPRARLRAQTQLAAAAALYQGARRYPAALAAGRLAEAAFQAVGDEYGLDRACAIRAAAQLEVALDASPGTGTAQEKQMRSADLIEQARATFAEVAARHANRGEAFDQALALNNIGLSHYYQQQFDEALSAYQRALVVHERLGERTRQAQVLQNMALLQYEIGRFREARASYTRVLPLVDEAENPKLLASILNNLALSEQKSGLPDAALKHYSQAMALLARLQDTRELARSVHGIGATYYDIGNRAEALAYYDRALQLRSSEFDPYGRLASLRGIADVLRDSGDIAGAMRRREEALSLAPTPGSRAPILVDLARDAVALHLREKADRYFAELFAIAATDDPVIHARALLERARFRFAAGSLDGAATDVAEAGRLFRSQELSSSVFAALLLESRIACARGDLPAAAAAADAAIAMSEQLRRASSNPMLRALLWQRVRAAFDLRIELLAQRRPCGQPAVQGGAERSLQVAERARSRALADFRRLSLARDLARQSPRERQRMELFEALAERRLRLEALSDSARESAAQLRLLRTEVAGLMRQIDILDAEIGGRQQPGDGIGRDIELPTETIGADTAVVEYWLGESNAYAWLVTKEQVRMYELGSAARIDAAARAYHAGLRDLASTSSGERLRRARELSALVLSPLQQELGRGMRVFFVPDGALHSVPFGALVLRSGGKEQFLVERHETAVAPAIRDLGGTSAGSAPVPSMELLMVADAVYTRDDPRFAAGLRLPGDLETPSQATLRGSAGRMGATESWRPLPASKREATNIAALFSASDIRVLSGFDASREKLLEQELGQFRILHFATHAVADSAAPQLSALVLSTWASDGRPIAGEVFAGDLLMRRLNADLVVLSACDTALGTDTAGEGLLGLRYAAHAGGARTVIASSWPVVDSVGEFIMTRLYSAVLRDKKSPAAAMAQAVRAARERWEDPALWAVFQVSVDSLTKH